MPKYTFSCTSCNHTKSAFVSISKTSMSCPECGSTMSRNMPNLGGQSQVNEVVDRYSGTVWKDSQREDIKERRDKYYWEVEVPRMVASGTYSLETMLDMGWVYLNDKGEMCVNNKPPSRR